MDINDKIEFHSEGEWTAVYLNGSLVLVGDHYRSQDWLEDYVGVFRFDSDDFLLGTRGDKVANTTAEILAYRTQKIEDKIAAVEAEKQAEIDALRARLSELES